MSDSDYQLPEFLNFSPDYRVVICSHHGSSYVRANFERHLRDMHNFDFRERTKILKCIAFINIAENVQDVSRPLDGGRPISGLPIHAAFECLGDLENCRYLTVNEGVMRKHHRTEHGRGSVAKGRPVKGTKNEIECASVSVQTLFAEKKYIDYFIISTQIDEIDAEEASQQLLVESQERSEQQQISQESEAAIDLLQRSYDEAQREYAERYNVVSKIEHVSELTKWLRETGYHDHIEGIEVVELPASYQLPDPEDEPLLTTICASVARVLRKGMEVVDFDKSEVRRLSRLNSRLLNTVIPDTISNTPFRRLQSEQSKQKYIQTMQKLFCYYSRVTSGTNLQTKKMFVPTQNQVAAWELVKERAYNVLEEAKEHQCNSDKERSEGTTRGEELIDRATLAFGLELLQHELEERVFDSALISWLVVLAWDAEINTWMRIGNYTSYLSQIVYGCRLLLLQHCLMTVEEDSSKRFTQVLIEFRNRWMLNDTPGPLGELLSTRLIGKAIAENTVEKAQVFWDDDGETVVYQDIRMPMRALGDLVEYAFVNAVEVFKRDLCFGLSNIPEYEVRDIAENINERRPGASFVTDIRNASRFDEGFKWLFHQVVSNPKLSELFIRQRRDETWYVLSDAAEQYEVAVQQFLEFFMTLVHVSSGQPGRRPEMIGLRWCNKQADVRNIFIRDGYVIFALSYNKSMNMTNAGRYPVRALLPEAGALLVQYLVLVIPFRKWLLSQTKGSAPVSEYLWSNDAGIWTKDRMTRVFRSVVTRATGIKLGVRSYRQIAIGVAIKKLAGAGLEDHAGSDTDSENEARQMEGSILQVFHHQAAHNPRTGNRAYGNPINFNNGLTEAAVQEYIHASRIWHNLVKGHYHQTLPRKHGRSQSIEMAIPLAKRIAIRGGKQRCRRNWTMEEAREVLRTLYPRATYKTLKQEQAVQAVIEGRSPVIAILGTGEGKSLLYMLQQKLPGAGITVLLVPLVA